MAASAYFKCFTIYRSLITINHYFKRYCANFAGAGINEPLSWSLWISGLNNKTVSCRRTNAVQKKLTDI